MTVARPASRHPTEVELELLKILWRDGPGSVRQVRETLSGSRDLAYTSVMTMLNIMTRKGYLRRAKQGGIYVYRARVTARVTARRMLGDLVDRVFDGSAATAAVHLLETADLDAGELRRLRALIDRKSKGESS